MSETERDIDGDEADTISVRVLSGIEEVSRTEWNSCAQAPYKDISVNPFVSYEFLRALEDSGAVSARTGWLPCHLAVEDAARRVRAVMPCYLKNHSFGEYVFDHGWADAYERAGGDYYPKMQVSVPFTPVTGPRLMAADGTGTGRARDALIAAALELCRRQGASSVHWTFLDDADRASLAGAGMLMRAGQQFHWTNAGYGSFDDFLGQLASRKRKAIRRERREALAAGVEIVHLTGAEIEEAHWDAFHAFYMDTGARKWGRPYLNREFFSRVCASMGDRIVLMLARRAGRWIAGALNFAGSDALYGRYWGCIEDHACLHFELCYYQAIEYAIANGFDRVEAGAQGQHKLARGYLPVITHSAHHIADRSLRRAVADYLMHERAHVEEEGEILAAHGPFRKNGDDAP